MIIEDFFDYNLISYDYDDLNDHLFYLKYNKYDYIIAKYVIDVLQRRKMYASCLRRKKTFKTYYEKYLMYFFSSLKLRIYKYKFIWKKRYYLGQFNIINKKIINNLKKFKINYIYLKKKKILYNNYNNFKDYFFYI